ncbi:MAG: endo alpha-1,4 polygalactosaminidase, partial [Alphaproteobacteria bacterium]
PMFLLASLLAMPALANERWAVYYGDKLAADSFAAHDVVVLDGEYTAPLADLKKQGKTVLGYISFGEAENYRSFFSDVKALNVLLEENPQWPGHIVVDVRKQAWRDYLINTLIPEVLARGFDGVMFDTVDSPLHIGHKNEEERRHMQQATIALLCEVRSAFPDIKIMINRGFDVFPAVAPCINMLLAESTLTDLQLDTVKKPRLLDDKLYGWYVDLMKRAQRVNPHLKIYTLDYWPQEDANGIMQIYATQRGNGFIPYVSTMELQQVYSEPKK